MTTKVIGSTLFQMTRDINGYNGFGLVPAYDIFRTTLTSGGGEQTFTVPSNYAYWIAVFYIDPGLRAFVSLNATATLPGAAFSNGGVAEGNPTALAVQAGDVIHMITPDTAVYTTVKLYARSLQTNG